MPVLDGYSFTRALRANLELKDIPLVITSAGIFDKKELEPGSWNIFIRKPFDLDRLIEQIAEIIAKNENDD